MATPNEGDVEAQDEPIEPAEPTTVYKFDILQGMTDSQLLRFKAESFAPNSATINIPADLRIDIETSIVGYSVKAKFDDDVSRDITHCCYLNVSSNSVEMYIAGTPDWQNYFNFAGPLSIATINGFTLFLQC